MSLKFLLLRVWMLRCHTCTLANFIFFHGPQKNMKVTAVGAGILLFDQLHNYILLHGA
jgi:hypothetical protein